MFTNLQWSKLHWFLIVFFTLAIYLSLGLNSHEIPIYRTTVGPAANSHGPVTIVIRRYQHYKNSGALQVPPSGWQIQSFHHHTTLTAQGNVTPLSFYVKGNNHPITFSLLHSSNAGIAKLVNDNNITETIPLHSNTQSSTFWTIGGQASNTPQSGTITESYPIFIRIIVFIFIFALFMIIARIQSMKDKSLNQTIVITWREVACFALPLFLSSTIVWLSFWPASTAWDGSLYWSNAVLREINGPYGRTMALFMRLFTYLSTSPAWLILFQNLFAAIGTSLILKELRYRGVSRWIAQGCTIVLAIFPQYPLFFNNLGSDALSTIGIIFLAWALLSITRHLKHGQLNYLSITIMVIAAVFAASMRVDMMPTAAFSVLSMCVFLYLHKSRSIALITSILFFAAVIFIPKIAFMLSDEQQAIKKTVVIENSIKPDAPLVKTHAFHLFEITFVRPYVFHLFDAAVHSGIPLKASDTEIFYKIAPYSTWANSNYICYMTDGGITPYSKGVILNPEEFAQFLNSHQSDLLLALSRIMIKHPSVLVDHQLCLTKMLWYIGYGQVPFLAQPSLGYDNVKDEFKVFSGENKALLSHTLRKKIISYIGSSENSSHFWFYWKPALILYFGLFCVLFRLTLRYDSGVLFILLIPVTRILVLMVLLPFPGYRYAYPAVLIMSLLCTFAFTPANKAPPMDVKKIE